MRNVCCALALLVAAGPAIADTKVVDLETRDTTIRLLIETPANPTHMIALLPGGKGRVKITADGRTESSNFAVRTRGLLHAHGFATAALDAPDDIPNLAGQRDRDEYATDMANVIGYLRRQYGLPVWLHGTSRGTVGIAMTVHKISDPAQHPDGIVLSASVTRNSNKGAPSVFDGDLSTFAGAALVLHHAADPCYVTLAADTPEVLAALKRPSPKKIRLIDGGGENARGRACGSKNEHSFIDVEADAIDAIATFIRTGN